VPKYLLDFERGGEDLNSLDLVLVADKQKQSSSSCGSNVYMGLSITWKGCPVSFSLVRLL